MPAPQLQSYPAALGGRPVLGGLFRTACQRSPSPRLAPGRPGLKAPGDQKVTGTEGRGMEKERLPPATRPTLASGRGLIPHEPKPGLPSVLHLVSSCPAGSGGHHPSSQATPGPGVHKQEQIFRDETTAMDSEWATVLSSGDLEVKMKVAVNFFSSQLFSFPLF